MEVGQLGFEVDFDSWFKLYGGDLTLPPKKLMEKAWNASFKFHAKKGFKMQELQEAIDREIKERRSDYANYAHEFDDDLSKTCSELHKTALKWADYSLRTYKGILLDRALDISSALVDFVTEMDELAGEE